MRKGRRWSALLQTCNMTPCSLYRPTSTSGTSRSDPAEAIPHPVGPDETAVGYPDAPRTALRAVTNSGARAFTGMRCESLSRPERQEPLNAAAILSKFPRRQPVQESFWRGRPGEWVWRWEEALQKMGV